MLFELKFTDHRPISQQPKKDYHMMKPESSIKVAANVGMRHNKFWWARRVDIDVPDVIRLM